MCLFVSRTAPAGGLGGRPWGWAPSSGGTCIPASQVPVRWGSGFYPALQGRRHPEGLGHLLRPSSLPGVELGFAAAQLCSSRRSRSPTRLASKVFVWHFSAPRSTPGTHVHTAACNVQGPLPVPLSPSLDRLEASLWRPYTVPPAPSNLSPLQTLLLVPLKAAGPV